MAIEISRNKARISRNLFPNGFSRNGLSEMEKWES